jgi:hypothetical protein
MDEEDLLHISVWSDVVITLLFVFEFVRRHGMCT